MNIHGKDQGKKYSSRDLLAAGLAFISLLVVISGISLTRQLSVNMGELSSNHLQVLAGQRADMLHQRFKQAIEGVQDFSRWIDITGDWKEREADIEKAAAFYGWKHIKVTDADGAILFETGESADKHWEDGQYDQLQGDGYRCIPFTTDNGEHRFTVQVPMTRDEKVIGTVCADYSSEKLFSDCLQQLKGEKIFYCLTNEQGEILYQNGDLSESAEAYENIFDMVLSMGGKAKAISFLTEEFHQEESGNEWLDIGGEKYILCYEPLQNDDSWYIIMLQPSTYLAQMSKYVTAYLFIICGLILLAALISIFIWGSRMKSKYEIRSMEAELDHANVANKAKSDFLSSMSHELRTPMNAIVGITTLAKRSADNPQKTREYLSKLEISTTYMLSLINDILDMSRIERGKIVLYRITFDLYDLIEAVDAIIRQISSQKSQKFDVSVSVTHNYIVCDKARLQQILVNLLNNAVKYTKEGGNVRLTVQEREATDEKMKLYIEVADTGIGIREEDLQRIFEPFEEASDKEVSGVSGSYGTGLGLSISQNLLRMMGSEIRVFSVPGKGSVFSFEIELEYAEESDAFLPKAHYGSWNLKGRRMLVAEDNDMNRDMLMDLLDDEGIICDPATDGKCALEMFRKSEPGTYDAVLMDIQMPYMDGLEATKLIRSSNHADAVSVPIVAMTAYAFTEDIERSIAAGMSAYTSKPVDIRELCKLLNKLIVERSKCA